MLGEGRWRASGGDRSGCFFCELFVYRLGGLRWFGKGIPDRGDVPVAGDGGSADSGTEEAVAAEDDDAFCGGHGLWKNV